jgi:hypothetical protein
MNRTLRPLRAFALAAGVASCVAAPSTKTPTPPETPPPIASNEPEVPPEQVAPPPPEAREKIPSVLPPSDAQKRLDAALTSYLAANATRRIYVMLDKPLYQPGETIWAAGSIGASGSLIGSQNGSITYLLLSPRGSQVLMKSVRVDARGVAGVDLPLPADIAGGEYTLRATSAEDATTDERKLIVSSYETPRLKKSLELLKKGYGPGDPVVAAVSVSRGTGEPIANKQLTAIATVDDAEVARLPVTTDAAGNAAVRFTLPAKIERGDALLTVSVEDAGITESIQKRIPVLLKAVKLQLFPEGGDLIVGLPSRVYFSATTPLGKPADVDGRVVDERGKTIAKFSSLHDGLGRFAIQPARQRSYHVEITRPTGIAEKFPLPVARGEGCTMQAIDDFDSKADEARVAIWCSSQRDVVVEAVLRDNRVASASAAVSPNSPTVVALPMAKGTQGVVQVTLLSNQLDPLAERLIYRGRGSDLKVKVTAQKDKLSPRDPVELTVETRDANGKLVDATVGVAVVDDTVISLADDKSAGILAHLYLEKDLQATPEHPIEEPNFYFSNKPHAAAALDLLVGTRGWRRFDWKMVLAPPPVATVSRNGTRYEFDDLTLEGNLLGIDGVDAARAMVHGRGGQGLGIAMPGMMAGMGGAPRARVGGGGGGLLRIQAAPVGADIRLALPNARGGEAFFRKIDRAPADQKMLAKEAPVFWTPVREFPVPDYSKPSDGPRSDFRETVYWNPSVQTGKNGSAKVKFYLSDAVTSFRATVEGRSQGGLPGRGELVMQSKLPLSLDAKLPLEVSSGDTIRLPVTVANETDRELSATLTTKFGAAFKLAQDPAASSLTLKAGERRTFFYPLTVVGNDGEGEVEIATATEGLHDELKKKIRVVPVGFPAQYAFSGTVKDRVFHDFDLGSALPHTVVASVTVYPSPLQQMVQGAEGMLQEPSGCFEQTSSTNYPNVMVSEYLMAHDVTDPTLIEKSHGLLERGYKRLTGYESPKHGYEWFGGDPGHEALTAYGLMEFNEMQKVYGEVDHTMIDRTAAWLYSRRDGEGGYLRNTRALDSFGGAPPEVTNGYITWALTEAGKRDLSVEIEAARKVARTEKDPYLLALAANTLLNVKDGEAKNAVARLAALQSKDGSFPGAKTSITRSGGDALAIETTALATVAMMKGNADESAVRAGAEWIGKHDRHGAYGSTQSTVLALKAINLYAEHTRRAAFAGVASIVVNGKPAGRVAFEKGRKEAIVFDDVAGALTAGKNTIELRLESAGGGTLPYAMAIDYRTALPASSPDAKVHIATKLARGDAKMGDTVRMHATVENVTTEGLPMVLARIGLPGGLTFQTWQLKELRDKGVIDFYETRPREVIVYYRSMAPSAKKEIDLDLMAYTPGTFTGPASSAYLYYTNENKFWADPAAISVGE